jgi:hypothetical protein
MNKSLKTLLLVSTIVLPLSACGHMHAKGNMMNGKQCKVSRNLDRAQRDLVSATDDLQAAADAAPDASVKKKLHDMARDAAKLADKAGSCKKMCDSKHDKEDMKPAAKPAHKKAHHAKPAAPVAPAPAKAN